MYINDHGGVVLTQEETDALDSMIRGIASRYHGWAGLDAQTDIVPGLWCKVLPIIAKKNEVNMNYLARACYFGCIDMYNAAKKIKDRQFPTPNDGLLINAKLAEATEETKSTVGTVDDMFKRSSGFDTITMDGYTDTVFATELLNHYKDGTPEHTYIRMVLQWAGMVETDNLEDVGCTGKEYKFARACGYASDTSSGYRNFKNRVRADLKKWFADKDNDEDTRTIYEILA